MAIIDKISAIADAIRSKTGMTDTMTLAQMPELINGIQTGGGSGTTATPIADGVNFYDYDGTCIHAYTVAEARALTELPAGPEHEGLVFQGWNWSLEDVRSLTRTMDIGALYTTDDGTTRLYITLQEGRTSPMLGVGVNGTVTVDWGDGTEPDVLTGTSASTTKWTPNHAYAAPGDYVIRLTVDGEILFTGKGTTNQGSYVLRHSSSANALNYVYQNALQKVEIGNGVISIRNYAFSKCQSLTCATIAKSVTSVGDCAFTGCSSLAYVSIPNGVTSIGSNAFQLCYSLARVSIPNGVTSIGSNAFDSCYSLARVSIPDGVTSIGSDAFNYCYSLASVYIPSGVTSIGTYTFNYCQSLAHVSIPDGVTSIGSNAFNSCYSIAKLSIPGSVIDIEESAFNGCYSLARVSINEGVMNIGMRAFVSCTSLVHVTFPGSVTSFGNYAFATCTGMGCYDFTSCTVVPPLSATNVFSSIPTDCEIRVPAALYDEWIAATNWATYADRIKAY